MRLIDADALKKHWNTQDVKCGEYTAFHFLESIDEQPTIEPKIIRCKDCKYWDTDYGLYGYCGRHGYHVSTFREGFCNLADRRK